MILIYFVLPLQNKFKQAETMHKIEIQMFAKDANRIVMIPKNYIQTGTLEGTLLLIEAFCQITGADKFKVRFEEVRKSNWCERKVVVIAQLTDIGNIPNDTHDVADIWNFLQHRSYQ